VIIAVVLHEYVKAHVARKLGDGGIVPAGRLSFNPKKHIDPLGGIFMLLFGFGWANPVKLSPFHYKDRKKAMLLIFAIPFIVSMLLGMLFFMITVLWFDVYILGHESTLLQEYIGIALLLTARINIGFALINLLPVYPFDGSILLSGLSPMAGAKMAQIERTVQIIVALLIIFGFASMIFNPLINQIMLVFLPTS